MTSEEKWLSRCIAKQSTYMPKATQLPSELGSPGESGLACCVWSSLLCVGLPAVCGLDPLFHLALRRCYKHHRKHQEIGERGRGLKAGRVLLLVCAELDIRGQEIFP